MKWESKFFSLSIFVSLSQTSRVQPGITIRLWMKSVLIVFLWLSNGFISFSLLEENIEKKMDNLPWHCLSNLAQCNLSSCQLQSRWLPSWAESLRCRIACPSHLEQLSNLRRAKSLDINTNKLFSSKNYVKTIKISIKMPKIYSLNA